MAAEYSYAIAPQTVAESESILFLDGAMACRKGFILHRDNSGIFRLRGSNTGRAIYQVTFNANIAVATGGTPGEISVSLKEEGETLPNTTSVVTTAAVGEFSNVSFSTFITLPCGCCATIAVENTSAGTAIDVTNANIIFDRVA